MKMAESSLKPLENTVGKGEIARSLVLNTRRTTQGLVGKGLTCKALDDLRVLLLLPLVSDISDCCLGV